MDTDSCIAYIKTDGVYKDITKDIESKFYTLNYELGCNFLDRPVPIEKDKKVIGLMKDESYGKVVTRFVGLKAKIFFT